MSISTTLSLSALVTTLSRQGVSHEQQQQHPGNACWRSKASRALGVPANEPVLHDFSEYDTHVYPIGLYPALRAHLRRGDDDDDAGTEGPPLAEVMSAGACEGDGDSGAVYEGPEEIGKRRRFRREMQFNLMATFMW